MDPRLQSLRDLRIKMALGQISAESYETKRLEMIDRLTGTIYPVNDYKHGISEVIPESIFEVKKNGPSHETVVSVVFTNNLEQLKRMIVDGGSINSRESDSHTTILMIAAGRGYAQIVEWLIDHGAHLNLQNNLGETALHFATVNQYYLIGELLIKRGADPKICDQKGFCALDLVPSIGRKRYEDALKKQERKKVKALTPALPKKELFGERSALHNEVSIKYPTRQEGSDLGGSALTSEMLKIFLPNKSYKTIMVTPEQTAGQVCQNFAARFSLTFPPLYLQLIEVTRTARKRIEPDTLILALKKNWPTIIGDTSSYYFEMGLTNKANDEVTGAFRRFVYGSAS